MPINNRLLVRKANGQKEVFQRRKVLRTCRRAGLKLEEAERVVRGIEGKLYNGISTRQILKMVLEALEKIDLRSANIYNLKKAMLALGPEGFIFEKFMDRLLASYGLKTEMPPILQGRCISHEVDITAQEPGSGPLYMIECKYHNEPGIYCGAKDALYTWARFVDLREGYKLGKCKQKFDQPWLITNTKFSFETTAYAQCKGMRLLGWRYPKANPLEKLIEKRKLYPITIIRHLSEKVKNRLLKSEIIFCQDLAGYNPLSLARLLGIRKDKAQFLINSAAAIIK